MNKTNDFTQLFRYAIVGGIAFIAYYGSLWTLTEHAGVHYLASAALAFALGLAVNYTLSKLWVFTENRYKSKLLEFALFTAIGIIGLGLNEALIFFISDCLKFHYMTGKVVSTAVVFFWNFLARKYMLFRA